MIFNLQTKRNNSKNKNKNHLMHKVKFHKTKKQLQHLTQGN